MRHGALFNGIGGFQLAAHWMGWENVWHCEIDEFCNKVVKQHFPNSICYEDIKQFDAREWKGKIDIISGGFPCQPFSTAGKRKGTADDRYLWKEMLRIIGEVQPRFVVGENVGGLVNWNGGMVFEQVQADLEAAGYESAAFILPACGKDAPHRRDRIWFIAHSKGERGNGEEGIVCETDGGSRAGQLSEFKQSSSGYVGEGTTPHTRSNGCEQSNEFTGINDKGIREGMEKGYEPNALHGDGNAADTDASGLERRENKTQRQFSINGNTWHQFPTQSPVCGRNDGISHRVDRIKALGNAIVPQVAYEIFRAIEQTLTA